MKAVKFLLALVAVALVFIFGFGYGRWYSTRPAAAKNTRKILYYVDAMHPWYKSDKPGIAPDCGMTLEPVYAGEAPPAANGEGPPPNTMLVGQDKQQLIGLRYGEAEWVTEGQTIRAAGRVAADETQISRVHSKVEGWIDHVSADFTGQLIQKGQPLLTLYSPEMLASQQELLLALKARDVMRHSSMAESVGNSESLVEAARRRLELWDLTGEQLAEVERTGKPIKSITLYAPATGYLTARNAFPGQKIMPETELYAITDLRRVWVMADVFESDATQVRMGQGARIVLPGGGALSARVSYLQPQIDPTTRTLKVRLDVANPGMRLRPEMFVDVEMQLGGARRLMVPADAVLDSGTAKTIFLDRGNGYFEPRQVETGQRIDDRVEIVKGLAPGERIVTSGAFLLNSESQLKPAGAAEVRP
ncbi:MAG: efflux RND transporter periplasmic adaptor subunit [Candidatus Sulfopaludibacter sp.]|nr:efflux RND transporter periplasmic adaptor subunit [Candidatus Sulfopaludibacter sp.]